MATVTKEERIAATVRRRIVDGTWQPGSALPTFTELEREFPVSRLTLQRAMGRLKQQRFIVTRERQGMSVATRPPHLNRYGILLAFHERHNRFWATLLHDAAELSEGEGWEFAVYRNLSRSNFDPAECERLKADVANHCLAGLFTVYNPLDGPIGEVLSAMAVPKVGLTNELMKGQGHVLLDNHRLLERALDWFLARGRRRIAILARGNSRAPLLEIFAPIAEQAPIVCPAAWRLPFYDAEVAAPVVELLMSLPPDQRPDGLLIADDTLIDPTARALLKAQVSVPDDLAVLAHCNWSSVVPCALPIERIGFETMTIVKSAVAMIDAMRLGREAHTVRIPPLFAHERQPQQVVQMHMNTQLEHS